MIPPVRRNQTARRMLLAAVLAGLSAPAGLAGRALAAEVGTEFDGATDFSKYKTYAWRQKPLTGKADVDARIVAGIETRLKESGWTLVETGPSDAVIAAHVIIREDQSIDTTYSGWGTGWNWSGYGVGSGVATTVRTSNRVGTLVVDIFDAQAKQLVWRATASDTLSPDAEVNKRKLNSVLTRMFRGFPPPGAPQAQSPPSRSSPPPDPGPAEKGKTFTTADGTTLWYETRGQGKGTPLLVANGGPGFDHTYLHCSDAWDRLSAGRQVIFYDQRGNGRSGALKKGQSCTVADQIADLEALRAYLGLERVNLLGHSWGGYLAMAYAARNPQRIARLVIADSAAPRIQDTAFLFKQIFPETTARQEALAMAVEMGDPAAVAADLKEYMTMLFVSPEARDAMMARLASFSYSQEVNKVVWTDAQRFDLNPELPKYRFPVLVLTGRYDINVAPSVAWGIHRAIPGSELAVFERSGHLPFCEEVDAFVSRMEAFLTGR